MKVDLSRFEVRLAATNEEVSAAQRLRYRVFVEELGAAASPDQRAKRLEFDRFDPYFDHLLLIDRQWDGDPLDRVVGVYRLMRGAAARAGQGFYGAGEYDLSRLTEGSREVVELGRSCVAEEYRGGVAMLLLWNGLADYVLRHDIQIMFGVASFHGTDPEPISEALSHLYYNYLAPADLRVWTFENYHLAMNRVQKSRIDPARAMRATPALIKSYLRLGGFVGDGAYIDHGFNTIDVCLVMDTERMAQKYRDFYTRGAA